jgi:hypothetical protein
MSELTQLSVFLSRSYFQALKKKKILSQIACFLNVDAAFEAYQGVSGQG